MAGMWNWLTCLWNGVKFKWNLFIDLFKVLKFQRINAVKTIIVGGPQICKQNGMLNVNSLEVLC